MSVNSKMTAIADKIRGLRGTSDAMGLDAMEAHLGNEQAAIASALAALAEKGVDVPAGSNSDALAGLIAGIQAGGSGADDILRGLIERTAREIVVPEGTTAIADYAFYSYMELTSIELPKSLISIGKNAFRICYGLKMITFPAAVTTISNWAFYDCANVRIITFEGTPTTIGDSTFKNCTNLNVINAPWAEGAVSGAPWGAPIATINYNYTGG